MPRVLLNGFRTAYRQIGRGPDVVLIHGLAANRAFWFMNVARTLRRQHRVTLYDLRGHGNSDAPASGYTPRQMADDLAALLDHLAIDRAIVVGHSFGGVVGLMLALRCPERVDRLVVADSRLNDLQPEQRLEDGPGPTAMEAQVIGDRDDWQGDTHVGISFLEEIARERHRELRARMLGDHVPFAGSGGGRDDGRRKWAHLLRTTTARRDFRRPLAIGRRRFETLNVPTLLVYGERSRCAPSGEALARLLPDRRHVVVPGAGHFHPLTQAGFFVDTLLAFLHERGAGADAPLAPSSVEERYQ